MSRGGMSTEEMYKLEFSLINKTHGDRSRPGRQHIELRTNDKFALCNIGDAYGYESVGDFILTMRDETMDTAHDVSHSVYDSVCVMPVPTKYLCRKCLKEYWRLKTTAAGIVERIRLLPVKSILAQVSLGIKPKNYDLYLREIMEQYEAGHLETLTSALNGEILEDVVNYCRNNPL